MQGGHSRGINESSSSRYHSAPPPYTQAGPLVSALGHEEFWSLVTHMKDDAEARRAYVTESLEECKSLGKSWQSSYFEPTKWKQFLHYMLASSYGATLPSLSKSDRAYFARLHLLGMFNSLCKEDRKMGYGCRLSWRVYDYLYKHVNRPLGTLKSGTLTRYGPIPSKFLLRHVLDSASFFLHPVLEHSRVLHRHEWLAKSGHFDRLREIFRDDFKLVDLVIPEHDQKTRYELLAAIHTTRKLYFLDHSEANSGVEAHF
jgi:hypothetical protein